MNCKPQVLLPTKVPPQTGELFTISFPLFTIRFLTYRLRFFFFLLRCREIHIRNGIGRTYDHAFTT